MAKKKATRKRRAGAKVRAKVRVKAKVKGPAVLSKASHQSGASRNPALDAKRMALPPGKRVSRTGRIYWETRRNRSDLEGGI